MDPDLLKKMALANWKLVNRLAAKRFHQQETAEEAALHVLEVLSQDNWQRLATFSGKAKFTTYFTTVVYRLLEDYSRKRFGRANTPSWLKRLGSFWISLYRLLCLERFSFNEAIHIVLNRQPSLSPQAVEQAAEEILGRVINCGAMAIEQHENYPEPQADETPYTQAAQSEQETVQQILGHIFFGDTINEAQQKVMDRLFAITIVLQPAEQLLLKLCYRDGLSQVEAGKLLGLNRFQINGRIRRTLAKIKAAFTRAGLAEELQLILDDNDT